jgi:arrestin-related trafficking adapter 4/5/7
LTRLEQVDGPLNATATTAPPVYGEHVLDQLFNDAHSSAASTPGVESGTNSPAYASSLGESDADLVSPDVGQLIPPEALSSRLQGMATEPIFLRSPAIGPGEATPRPSAVPSLSITPNTTPPSSAPLSRHPSGTSISTHRGLVLPQHIELSKVPSYATAMKTTKVGPISFADGLRLPDYVTATSAPSTPSLSDSPLADPMATLTIPGSTLSRGRSESGPQQTIAGAGLRTSTVLHSREIIA